MTTTMQRPAAHPSEELQAPTPGPDRRRRRTLVVVLVAGFLLAAAVIGGIGGSGVRDTRSLPSQGGAAVDVSPGDVSPGDVVSGDEAADPTLRSTAPELADPSAGAPAPFAATTPLPGTGPRVVRTAALTVVVPRAAAVDDAVSVARATAETNGGYVGDLERSALDGTARATVTLRVPAASFDAVTARLEKIGDVASSSLGGTDVTQESVDLDARLRSLQAQADALRAILAQATTVPDILAVRQQLDAVQTEIETVTARAAQLADAVAFATVTATFTTSATSVVPQPESWWRSTFAAAAARLGSVTGTIVVGAAALLPVVALGLVGWGVVSSVRRRRRVAAAAAADA